MLKLSVVIITFNEERNISRCLDSVKSVADEVVVVDSFSTDRTRELAITMGARVIEHVFEGYIEQKNWAATHTRYPLILSLDADEALDEELQQSVLQVKTRQTPGAYTMNRLSHYGGQWIRHSGWYPDRKLRLWSAGAGRWTGTNPHESFKLYDNQALITRLPGHLLHFSYYTLSEHIQRANKYSIMAARALYQQGKTIAWPMIIIKAVARFIKAFVIKGGFRGGIYGWIICCTATYEVFLKYSRLYLLQQGKEDFAA